MKFLNKIENDKFDIEKGHKHDGVDSPLLRDIDRKTFPEEVDYTSTKTLKSFDAYLYCCKFVNGLYIACDSSTLYKSVDGVNFEVIERGFSTIVDVTYANGVYVLIASKKIFYSYDLETFTQASITISQPIYNVIYAFGKFLVTGRNSAYYSANGISWSSATVQQYTYTTDLELPFYANEKVIACVNNMAGKFYTTTNGTSWTLNNVSSGVANEPWIRTMAYGNGIYVAANYKSHVYVSPDLTNWTKVTTSFVDSILTISFQGGNFIATGSSGGFYTSKDGMTWTRKFSSLTTKSLEILGEANGELLFWERSFSPNNTKIYETNSSKLSTYETVENLKEKVGELEYDGPVEIWSGTASANDDITFSQNVYNFRFLIVRLGGGVTYIPCPVMKGVSTAIRGTNSYNNGTYTELYSFRGTLSDGLTMKVNSLLVQLIKTTGVSNSTAYTTVTKIYGMK